MPRRLEDSHDAALVGPLVHRRRTRRMPSATPTHILVVLVVCFVRRVRCLFVLPRLLGPLHLTSRIRIIAQALGRRALAFDGVALDFMRCRLVRPGVPNRKVAPECASLVLKLVLAESQRRISVNFDVFVFDRSRRSLRSWCSRHSSSHATRGGRPATDILLGKRAVTGR